MKATLLAILLVLTGFSTAGATDFGLDCMFGTEDEWEEQGVRLGDTLDDFIAVFGEPEEDGDSPEWDINDCGTIFVTHTEDERIITIEVFAPEGKPFTVGQVRLITNLFIPEDAEPVRDQFIDGTGFEYVMRSETLLESLPTEAWDHVDNTPQPGQFTALYWMGESPSEPGKFKAAFITLEVEE